MPHMMSARRASSMDATRTSSRWTRSAPLEFWIITHILAYNPDIVVARGHHPKKTAPCGAVGPDLSGGVRMKGTGAVAQVQRVAWSDAGE
jgi:hypothetical protein